MPAHRSCSPNPKSVAHARVPSDVQLCVPADVAASRSLGCDSLTRFARSARLNAALDMRLTKAQSEAWEELERRWGSLGFEGLSVEEKETIALFWLEGEVMNGGLYQFFSNSSADLAPLAESALSRLGASVTLALLQK